MLQGLKLLGLIPDPVEPEAQTEGEGAEELLKTEEREGHPTGSTTEVEGGERIVVG
jgi:hypothetical protein